MFFRRKKNKSGSTSVQILQKENGKNVLLKTIGSAVDEADILILVAKAKQHIHSLKKQRSLFNSDKDVTIEGFISEISNGQIRTIGPELVFGRIYDYIGYSEIDNYLFRHLVIARLAYPLSKLKTIDYLYRYQGVLLNIDSIYRFLDTLTQLSESKIKRKAKKFHL